MLISEAKEAFKICDIILDKNHLYSMKPIYCEKFIDANGKEHEKSIIKYNVARTYFIVVDGEIYKIGQSGDKGGMKKTLAIYMNGGLKGSPSPRSIGIWYLMYKELLAGRKVEIYMHYMDEIWAWVPNFLSEGKEVKTRIDPKCLESVDLEAYRTKEGVYPPWNFQENGKKWPKEVIKLEIATKNKDNIEKLLSDIFWRDKEYIFEKDKPTFIKLLKEKIIGKIQ
jgi:hypothetical protein